MLNTYIHRKKIICIIQQNSATSFNRIAKCVEGDREEGAGEKRRQEVEEEEMGNSKSGGKWEE